MTRMVSFYLREPNMGFSTEKVLESTPHRYQRTALLDLFASVCSTWCFWVSPCVYRALFCMLSIALGLRFFYGAWFWSFPVVFLSTLHRIHSARELCRLQTCVHPFLKLTPCWGFLGPGNSQSYFWSLHMLPPWVFLHVEGNTSTFIYYLRMPAWLV